MKKSEKKILTVEIILILTFIFNIFVLKNSNQYLIATVLAIALALLYLMVGFEKDNLKLKRDLLMTTLIYVISYYILTYILGIFFEFLRSPYSLSLVTFLRNVTPVLVFIFAKELLRYEISTKGERNGLLILLSIVLFILVDTSTVLYKYDLTNVSDLVKFLEVSFFPLAAENVMLTYLVMKGGYTSAIAYQVVMKMPVYVVPIVPNINTYIDVIFRIVFPLLLLHSLYGEVSGNKERQLEKARSNHLAKRIVFSVSVVILVVTVYLTSGLFTYYAVTIGSGSMIPNLGVGDIVIVRKTKDYESLEVGDILVYNKETKVVVHRITEKNKVDNEYVFRTKGDANDAEDWYDIYEEDIIGTVKAKVKYLGYPTIWVNKLVK
mgnify:FL=1